MRAYEDFSGCRVDSFCVMSNHFHIEVEVPRRPAGAMSDWRLLKRLRAIYSRAHVEGVAAELREARKEGVAEEVAAAIHARYAYRMYDLSQFMKGLLQRFSQWFNKVHKRKGTLWRGRFTSILVDDDVGGKAVAAYGDLNPVRAGIVKDPQEYRWSSYGEAQAGGCRAQAGLVRVMCGRHLDRRCHRWWGEGVASLYRRLLLEGVVERFAEGPDGVPLRVRRGMSREQVEEQLEVLERVRLGTLFQRRVRYFTAGAAVGSREFVETLFASAPERFSVRRKTGARRWRGAGRPGAGWLWSLRDLRPD